MRNKHLFYAGSVWLVSAGALIAYGVLGLLLNVIPGIEQLVQFIDGLQGKYIYLAAFLTILIEGLYIVGNFFPGSSSVLILAVLSQFGGPLQFLATILAIFIGWSLAGAINIFIAHQKMKSGKTVIETREVVVADKTWATWFPPFRASYEVAQVAEGGNPRKILVSSIRVKLITCTVISVFAFVLPNFVNVHEFSNQDGFVSLVVIAGIMIFVGIKKIQQSKQL